VSPQTLRPIRLVLVLVTWCLGPCSFVTPTPMAPLPW
jgi:hypothetical protein